MTHAARARRRGRRWPSSAGSGSRCRRRTAGAPSGWSRARSSSRRWAAPPAPARTSRRCSPPGRSRKPAATRRRSAGSRRSPRATIAFLDADLDWRPDAIQTRAETTAGGWALSGRKQFVPWAHVASVLLVPAKTPDGLTLFLVDPGAAGLTLEPAQMMDPATRLASVTLEGTPVTGAAVLGTPGQAGPLLKALLSRGAVGAAAEMLGAARRCLDMAVGYAKVREQFGQPIGSFQ